MRFHMNTRHFLSAFLPSVALLLGIGLAGGASAGPGGSASAPANSPAQSAPAAPNAADAFAHLDPASGAPANNGTVSVGAKFTLNLLINSGSNTNLTAQQSYLTFNSAVLQVVDPAGTTCNPVNAVTVDNTVFDSALQNEVCNGPTPCEMRNVGRDPGFIGFASGALSNCPQGCNNHDFRVASITFCALNGGDGTIRWNFSPPDPTTVDSEIVALTGDLVHDRNRYQNYTVHVTGATATPGPPTSTRTPTPQGGAATPTRSAGTTPPPSGCAMNFTDVHSGDPFYQYISSMYCRSPRVISGYNDNTFRPYDTSLRSQVAKMIVLSFNIPHTGLNDAHFSDVPKGTEIFEYVEAAYKAGIITGFSDGTFRPWDQVKRGQLAKIVVLGGKFQINTAGGPHFTDVGTDNAFYPYIETAYNHGIIAGYSDIETARAKNMISGFDNNTFLPYDVAKRGQICKILDGALTGR